MGGDDAKAGFKMPEAPILAAGGLGGPFCMLTVTPFRNALTFGSKDASLSVAQVMAKVFARGTAGAWTGGIYPAIAACPQFLCLGPMYHLYASATGPLGGIVLTGITETAVLYGAETKNAQLAIIGRGGNIPAARVQSPFNPLGPGASINCFRNILAMSGMRVVNKPIAEGIEKLAGSKSTAVAFISDLAANIVAACITAPIHMLYQYTATTPEIWDLPRSEKGQAMKTFLSDQYFPGGKLSTTLPRDLFLRSLYIATAYTMYLQIEKGAVKYWPK